MKEIEFKECDRYPDESDRASSIEAANNEEAIQRVLYAKEKTPDYFDGIHCTECNQEIPEDRLKIGAFRDIVCQTRHEHHAKMHRRDYER